MNEGTGWQGQFDIFIKSKNGEWEHERTIKNTVVDSGLNLLREALRWNSHKMPYPPPGNGISSAKMVPPLSVK